MFVQQIGIKTLLLYSYYQLENVRLLPGVFGNRKQTSKPTLIYLRRKGIQSKYLEWKWMVVINIYQCFIIWII